MMINRQLIALTVGLLITKKQYLKSSLIVILSYFLVNAQSVSASDWFNSIDENNGFSEFSPPTVLSSQNQFKNKQKWRTGSSFNDFNKQNTIAPRESRNPWKPHVSKYGKQTFSSNRPWGRLPDRKPVKANNMQFHDRQFKRWINQVSDRNRNDTLYSNLQDYKYSQNNIYDPLLHAQMYGYSNEVLYMQPVNPVNYSSYQVPGGYVPFRANAMDVYNIRNTYYQRTY